MAKSKTTSTREDYLQILLEPQHFDLDKKAIAKLLGCTVPTLYKWDKKIDLDWIKDERRRKYAWKISLVDLAMFKKAVKGDTRAAELVYKRFDGWIDATKVIDERTGKTDDELRDMANAIGEQLAEQSGTGKNKTGNSPRTGTA